MMRRMNVKRVHSVAKLSELGRRVLFQVNSHCLLGCSGMGLLIVTLQSGSSTSSGLAFILINLSTSAASDFV